MGPPPQQGRREKVYHSGAWDTLSEGTLSPLFQRVLGGLGLGRCPWSWSTACSSMQFHR